MRTNFFSKMYLIRDKYVMQELLTSKYKDFFCYIRKKTAISIGTLSFVYRNPESAWLFQVELCN